MKKHSLFSRDTGWCRVSGRNCRRKWDSAPLRSGQRRLSTIRYPAFGFCVVVDNTLVVSSNVCCFFISVYSCLSQRRELGNLPAINNEPLNENKPYLLLMGQCGHEKDDERTYLIFYKYTF